MRHIIPISGKDSLATAITQRALDPSLHYEYVFNPTGAEFPEVYEWIDRVERYLGAPIVRIGEDLFEIIEDYNYFLPSRRARYCTRQAKIEPFEKWIGKDEATVYYGIRADEERGGYDNSRYPNIIPAYPLKDVKDEDGNIIRSGISIGGVYRICALSGLKPPTFFWKSVYDAVVIVVGQSAIDELAEWQVDILFAGRTRANCFFCFNQMLFEWVWLSETHPDLFWKAEGMEHMGSEYTWNSAHSLKSIYDRRDAIKAKLIKRIVKIILQLRANKVKQVSLFDFNNETSFTNYFNQTSCGLFCGK